MTSGMSTVATVIPVVGLPTLIGWSQVVHSHIHQLVCALAVSGPGAHNVGRDLVDVLSQAEPTNSVELHQLILDLLAKTRKAEVQLNLVAILYRADRLVMAACNGQVLYQKPNSGAKLLLNADAQPQIIEGKLVFGTTLVALTDQVASHTESLLDQLNHGWEAERLVTNLLPILHNQPDSSLCALACLNLQPNETDNLTENYSDQPADASENPQAENLQSAGSKPLAQSRRFLFAQNLKLPATSWVTQVFSKALNWLKTNLNQFKQASKLRTLLNWQTWPKFKQTRFLILVGASLAIGCLVIAGLWFQGQQRAKNLARVLTEIKPPNDLIVAAKLQLATDPVAARDKTNQAVVSLSQLKQKYPKPAYLTKPITSALTAAEQFAAEISGLSQLKDLNIFSDLRLATPNFIANSISISADQAYFIDQELKQLIKLDLVKKQYQNFNLAGLTKISQAVFLNQQFYFLGDGIYNLNPDQADGVPQLLKAAGDSDREATFMKGYGSYLYLLNPTKRNIFRFSITKPTSKAAAQALSEPIGWIVDKKGLDFSILNSLAVDGDVWLTTKTGQVLKFTQGQPVDWQITGLKIPFDTNIILVTDEQLAQIYVLEPSKRRLVILSKSGQFLKELQSPTLAAVTSFGVSETLQKAFLVSGSTVYELGI